MGHTSTEGAPASADRLSTYGMSRTMGASIAVVFALIGLSVASCGSSHKSGASTATTTLSATATTASTGGSSPSTDAGSSSGSDSQATQLEATCVSDYQADDWGPISGSDGSADPTSYCNCVIPSWLSSGGTPDTISAAMQSSATDSGGVAPIAFNQQSGCGPDPTIDPNTGAPWNGAGSGGSG